ncbi:MAG TPA: PAS domain S-box protein [Streptosporangiaceae bacterium]|nr:PAS domain S-box protein [Streptosporangiaceae bacterium]
MPSTPYDGDREAPDLSRLVSSVNSVLSLSLILAQTSTPAQAMRLVTTAVPSIAASQSAVAWHPSRSGDYFERAPEDVGALLADVTGVTRLDGKGPAVCWAFPIASPFSREQVFLIVTGSQELSDQETFLLSILAQLCGTVITSQESIAAERERLSQIEARQRAILEAALDAVISIDQDARVTYVNSAFERTFGYRAEEVIGHDLADKIVPPSLREAHRRGLARYLETEQAVILDRRIELSAMRADGTVFPAEVTVTRTGLPGEAAFTGYVRDITDRQRAEHELMASRARLVTTSDAARQRLTRDLHDGAQQHLVATLINLQLAEQRWASAPDRARELVGQALEDTRRGIEDLRELAAGLHPAILTQHGLALAIRALADRVGILAEIEVPGVRLPPAIEASLYFFCSEALTNIVKHAHATRAWVRLEIADGRCVVEVRDDGIGGAHPGPETSGLIGLSDRIGAIGGTLDITSPHSGGTTLRASVPVPVPDVKIKGDLSERAVLRAPSLVTASRRIGPQIRRRTGPYQGDRFPGPSCHDQYLAIPRPQRSPPGLRRPGPGSRHPRLRLGPVGLERDGRPPPAADRPVRLPRRRRHRGTHRP